MLKYKIFIIFFITLITACSSSDSGDNNSSVVATVESFSDDLVYSEKKTISGTVFENNVCLNTEIQSTYFETENIAVFGALGVSEKSFQIIATFAEESLELVSEKYGISVSKLLSMRTFYTEEAFSFVKDAWLHRSVFESLESADPVLSEHSNDFVQDKFIYDYFYSMSKLEQSEALDRIAVYRNQDLMTYREDINILEIPSQLVICVSSNNLNSVAVAGPHGLQVQPPSQAREHNREHNFEKYRRIVTHELIHVSMFVVSTRGTQHLFPIWFGEGVAEYLSGGIVANPVSDRRNITSSKTEMNYDEYDDAARVIEYIVDDLGNGKRSIYELMLYMREKADGSEQPHYNHFDEAFEETFTDYDGSKLEYSELQNEYFDRLQ